MVKNLHKDINYLPYIRVTTQDTNRIKELNESVTVASDETMIVVGTLRVPDGMEIVLEGDLVIC